MSRQPSDTAEVRAGAEAEQQRPSALEKKLEALPQLVQGLSSDDSSLQLEAIKELRKLLSIGRNPPIQEVINSGEVPFFVQLLTRDDCTQIQFEAAQALTVIVKGTSENTKVVVDQGAVPIFVKLLSSPSEDIRQEAVRALGNVANDSAVFHDIVLAHDVLLPLLQLLKGHPRHSLLRDSTWTLSIICRGSPQLNFEHVKSALQVLRQLIDSQDEVVLSDACWAISFMFDGCDDSEKIQALIDAGVCPRLVEILSYNLPMVVYPALSAVRRIANGDDAQIQCIIDHEALPHLLNFLVNDDEDGDVDMKIKERVCSIIAQMTNTNEEQLQAVIDGNIFGALVHLMQTAAYDVKKEAALGIANATEVGTPDQIKYLVSEGCIKAFRDLLCHSESDILTACLDGLMNILLEGEDVDFNPYVLMIEDAGSFFEIDDLKNHHDRTIFEKASALVVTFWPEMYESVDGHVFDPPQPGGSNLD